MDVVYAIQSIATPWLDTVMTLVTDLGSEEAYIAMVIATYLAIDARAGQRLGVLLVTSFFLNQYAKGFFDTPRPFELDPDVVRTERARAGALGAGFPSGHAQSSATFWLYAAALARRPWFWPVAVLLVAVISLSRLYLGVHVPVDVVGGLVIGVALVAVAVLLDRSGLVSPRWLLVLAGIAIPLGAHLRWPTPESDLLAGALSALVIAPVLLRHRTDGAVAGRVAVALIGVALAFTVITASSVYLPEAIKRDPLVGYVRYLGVGLTGLAVAPWVGRALGLTPGPSER